MGLSVQQKKRKIDFPIGKCLAIFDLQVIPMLPSKFQVNRPFGSGEEAQKRFLRWPPWPPSSVQEKKRKIDFQDGRHL